MAYSLALTLVGFRGKRGVQEAECGLLWSLLQSAVSLCVCLCVCVCVVLTALRAGPPFSLGVPPASQSRVSCNFEKVRFSSAVSAPASRGPRS